MSMSGHCYCGSVRFEASGEPLMKGQCYCRECQFISGGGPNNFLAMPAHSFHYTAGAPKAFGRFELARGASRIAKELTDQRAERLPRRIEFADCPKVDNRIVNTLDGLRVSFF